MDLLCKRENRENKKGLDIDDDFIRGSSRRRKLLSWQLHTEGGNLGFFSSQNCRNDCKDKAAHQHERVSLSVWFHTHLQQDLPLLFNVRIKPLFHKPTLIWWVPFPQMPAASTNLTGLLAIERKVAALPVKIIPILNYLLCKLYSCPATED